MVKIMENPIKIDDLGVPLYLETPRWMMISLERGSQASSKLPKAALGYMADVLKLRPALLVLETEG